MPERRKEASASTWHERQASLPTKRTSDLVLRNELAVTGGKGRGSAVGGSAFFHDPNFPVNPTAARVAVSKMATASPHLRRERRTWAPPLCKAGVGSIGLGFMAI